MEPLRAWLATIPGISTMARNARAMRVSVIFGSPWGSSKEQNLGGRLSARTLIADRTIASMAGDEHGNQYHGEECESDESVSHFLISLG